MGLLGGNGLLKDEFYLQVALSEMVLPNHLGSIPKITCVVGSKPLYSKYKKYKYLSASLPRYLGK